MLTLPVWHLQYSDPVTALNPQIPFIVSFVVRLEKGWGIDWNECSDLVTLYKGWTSKVCTNNSLLEDVESSELTRFP